MATAVLGAVASAVLEVAAEVGLTQSIAVSGIAGALVSLFTLPVGTPAGDRVRAVGYGVLVAWFTVPALTVYFEVKATLAGGLAFVMCLWGLAVVSEGTTLLKSGRLREVLEKFLGMFNNRPTGGV